MYLTKFRAGLAAAAFMTLASVTAVQAADEVFISDAGKSIAINGYDAVAYHTVGAPTQGSAEFKVEYEGAVWKFSSAANMEAFKADPAKFAPAFGGWCTVGASKGKKIATQPEFFSIVDGQLYLNSSDRAQNLFLQDKPGTISTANTNWTSIQSTPADQL